MQPLLHYFPLCSSCLPAVAADKNPVLTEFATEVSKMINEAVAALEAGSGSKA